ncbi:uncharacterized protein LOC144097117 [Amblyomma americanum]
MATASFGKEDEPAPSGDNRASDAPVAPKSRPRQYPSEWFEAHPGSKPTVCVPQCFASEDELVKAVADGLATGRLPVEYAVQFMHVEGAKIRATLNGDWVSFGLTIGRAGEEISPWDLLAVSQVPGPSTALDAAKPAAVEDIGRAENRKGLFAVVVCMYRILDAKGIRTTAGVLRLQERLKKILEPVPFCCTASCLERGGENFGDWLNNQSYLSLIAALDMFLNHFPRHEMQRVRAGTLSSRYKYCAVLQDITHLHKTSGTECQDLIKWLCFPCFAEEGTAIMKGGQELLAWGSYSPYLIDLGLCRRSPYSAALNPLVHYWCHASAAMMEPTCSKSLNARITSDEDLAQVTDIAMAFAYAHSRCELGICFFPSKEEAERYNREKEAALAARDIRETPITTRVEDWERHLSATGFTIHPAISEFAQGQVRKFRNVREGTVRARLIELILKSNM